MRAFGRYRVFGELGRGAMGVVYRGFDPVIGRVVALKTLFQDSGDGLDKDLRERLYREAAAAGALSHPNIVTIYDIVEDRGVTAVAMEFIEGQSLADLLTEKGPLPVPQALDILEQVCSALDYAASHGVVHRDIKPANILMTAAGQVKITDFGIARLAQSSLTKVGTVLGSPAYMSPEQVGGLAVDGGSDLFAAALVFYEMLTRERPFGGKDATGTMHAIVHDDPLFNPSVGSAVMAVLLRALEKDPADRYQTGAFLVSELRRVTGVAAGTVPAARAAAAPASPSSGGTDAGAPPSAPGTSRQATAAAAALASTAPAASKRRQTVLVQGVGSLVLLLAVVAFLVYKGTAGPTAPGSVPPGEGVTTPQTPSSQSQPSQAVEPVSSRPAPQPSAPASPKAGGRPAASPPPRPAATTPAETPQRPVTPPPAQAEVPPPPVAEPAPPPPAPAGRAYEQMDVDVRPAVVKTVPAEYPRDAVRRRVEDTVVLKVLVSVAGRVDQVQVLRGSKKDLAFDQAAIAAVRQWVFSPAQKAGKPVACWFSVAVPFQLLR
jgi:serine/threonine-protein kinase